MYYNIPIEVQYQFAKDYSMLVGGPKFINYRKDKLDPEYEKVLLNLEKRYKITRTSSEEYFKMLIATPEGQKCLQETMEMYSEGKQ